MKTFEQFVNENKDYNYYLIQTIKKLLKSQGAIEVSVDDIVYNEVHEKYGYYTLNVECDINYEKVDYIFEKNFHEINKIGYDEEKSSLKGKEFNPNNFITWQLSIGGSDMENTKIKLKWNLSGWIPSKK